MALRTQKICYGPKGVLEPDVLSGYHKTNSAALVRLLKKLSRYPEKERALSEWQKHKKKERTIVSNYRKKLKFPYNVVPAQYEHHKSAHLQYHCA